MYVYVWCRVDALVIKWIKIDWFKIIGLKLQAVSNNTTHPIIPASTLNAVMLKSVV